MSKDTPVIDGSSGERTPSATSDAGTGVPSSPKHGNSLLRRSMSRVGRSNQLGVAIVTVVLIFGIGSQHSEFLRVKSLANIAQSASAFGIIALGMVFLMAMRELDLSVGSIYSLSLTTAALVIRDGGLDPWVGGLIALVVGVLLGMLTGLAANVLKLPVLIVSLAATSIYRGIGLVRTDATGVSTIQRDADNEKITSTFYDVLGGEYFGIPAIVYAFLLSAIVMSFVFRFTRFGFAIRAIGSNPQAAALSGYSVRRLRVAATALVGGMAGLSALMTLAFFEAADPNQGLGYEFLVIAAAIIGGTSLVGGRGSVGGAALGAIIISVIQAGLVQFGVNPNAGLLVTGTVILAAVALDSVIRRRQARAS